MSSPSPALPLPSSSSSPVSDTPSPFAYLLSFILVGTAWGFTTPFIRRAAMQHTPPEHSSLKHPPRLFHGRVGLVILTGFWKVADLLRDWRYALPLIVNLTGSVWFFLLVGQAELSLTVPITNSLAFLFTVLGEWIVEKKVIGRDTGIGMVLVLLGIVICVGSKREQGK